ncbi:MAG: hypothetical protein KGI71_04035 [Patescibacteria group bacterium]|nr:hypothetical protein [Patescibacteria group bacterium]
MTEFIQQKFTLNWLEGHVKNANGCLVWVRSFTASGQPYAVFRTPEGTKSVRIRRLVWESANERQAPEKQWGYATCGTAGCVHPDHVSMRLRSAAMRPKWTQELAQELAGAALS